MERCILLQKSTLFHNYKERFKGISYGENQFTNSNEKSKKTFSAVVINCCCLMFIPIPITNIVVNDCCHFCGSCFGRIING